jgi:putative phosphoesterase
MAIVGLLSDSHGNDHRTTAAVRLLCDRGVEMLIHLGDVGSEAVLDAMVVAQDAGGQLVPQVHVVFGNTDHDHIALGRYAVSIGIKVHHPMGRLEVEGKTIAFTHGDRQNLMDQALADEVDYLCHGHTHECRFDKVDQTRVINPGALTRAQTYTAAVLTPRTGQLSWVEIGV